MRIIAGEARGRTLVAPAGSGTRPTQDYVRESLFNILAPRLEDARVLDLFAGTGALSLEAISRGAAYAALCDKDRAALSCIRKNIEAVRCGDRCSVFAGDYAACIRRLSGEKPFDIVFLDPPYRMENTGEICSRLREAGLLSEEALIVVEHRRGTPPEVDAHFRVDGCRRYGDTEISFVVPAAQGEQDG
ncbi:MAG: 16S rRNA (guanine(966)-N(2))-methyltransferase RsmD [Clostridia bacterium]|nr:16S rRNA (guanine(966)-N(2))-methyltransferase RsmD [Clostridia bacterium]